MFLICSIVPVSSCICPSIELTRVFKVETDPIDLSSLEVECFSVCVMVFGIEKGRRGEGDWPAVHLRAVLLPRVETESSSFP